MAYLGGWLVFLNFSSQRSKLKSLGVQETFNFFLLSFLPLAHPPSWCQALVRQPGLGECPGRSLQSEESLVPLSLCSSTSRRLSADRSWLCGSAPGWFWSWRPYFDKYTKASPVSHGFARLCLLCLPINGEREQEGIALYYPVHDSRFFPPHVHICTDMYTCAHTPFSVKLDMITSVKSKLSFH